MYICSNLQDFKKKFTELNNPKYLVFFTGLLPHKKETLELNFFLKKKKKYCLENILTYKKDIYRQINTFFIEDTNKNWFYAYTSKVLLSLSQFEELRKFFLINSFLKKKSKSNLIIYCPDKKIKNLLHRIYLDRKNFLNFGLPTFYAWLRFLRTFFRVLINFRSNTNPNPSTVVFTISLPTSKNYIDPYFGRLPLTTKNDKNIIFIYLGAGNRIRLFKNYRIMPLESFARASDVIYAWFFSLAEGWKCSHQKNDHRSLFFYEIHKFLKESEINKGDFFYYYFMKLSFSRMLNSLRPIRILYPFENRSWEKILLQSSYEAGVKKTIGYQHSSITERHLALKNLNNELDSKYLPSKIITIGQFTYDWLKRHSPLISKNLIKGGSLRKVKEKLPLPNQNGILVALSSSINEAHRVLSILNKLSFKLTIPIIVRSHPTINIDNIFNGFEWSSNITLSKSKKLSKDLASCDAILYSSSTVVLEGMLSGRLPIFLDIGDIPSGDPLLGNAIFSVKNEKDILNVIKEITILTNSELKKIQLRVKQFSRGYLQDISERKFLSLVNF